MATHIENVLDLMRGVHLETAKPNSCILASMVFRDALRELGVPAEVKSVALDINASAYDANIGLHSLGVGMNKLIGEPYTGDDWDGHLIVAVPGYIIDPSFHASRRWAWSWTPDVAIIKRDTPIIHKLPTKHGYLPVIARWLETMPDRDNYKFLAQWASHSVNRGYLQAPDYRDPVRRREPVQQIVSQLKEHLS